MRIVYVIEKLSTIGGMERVLTDKMNYLAAHTAHEVVLMLVWHDPLPPAYPLHERIAVLRLGVPYVRGGLTLPLALLRYNRYIRRLRPRCTVLTWVFGAFAATFGTHCGKTIYELHRPAQKMKHRWLQKLMQRRTDCIVTLTKTDAACYPRARHVAVIPNFTDMHFSAAPDYSAKVVVSAGRDIPEKDFPRLRRLWDSLRPGHPDWQLHVHHSTPDMAAAYLEGSVYAMTSRFEGFPMVLIEAMRCGLPLIAFDCPNGPRDIIEDGVTGYLIPYDDDDKYINRLNYLMEHPEAREQLGRAARKASERYLPAPIMSQWLKLFLS